MLNATDQATFLSVRELRRSVQEAQKPLVYWIGAGASKWLNYPLWKELARQLRRPLELSRNTFVEKNLHPNWPTTSDLASSSAEIAASRVTVRKSSRNSSSVSPPARHSSSSSNGSRVPQNT